jgi:hypothetical protein
MKKKEHKRETSHPYVQVKQKEQEKATCFCFLKKRALSFQERATSNKKKKLRKTR